MSGASLLLQLLPRWRRALPDQVGERYLERYTRLKQPLLRQQLEALSARRGDQTRRRKSCGDSCDLTMFNATACGAKAHVALPSAGGSPQVLPARYCLVRASQIITSHDPLNGFAPRPNYPSGIQERRYRTDEGEQLKVFSIAQSPQPAVILSTDASATDGPPVVVPNGVALGGNGRSMGVQLSYARGDRVYADWLREHAEDFGLLPEEVDEVPVEGGDGPMVVRVVDIPQEGWAAAVRALNTSLTQSLDATAESVAIARQLPEEALQILAVALAQDDMDLGEFLKSERSRPFVQALQRVSIITSQNANRLLAGGLLSDKGRELLVPALYASIVPDADLLDAASTELRNALARSAPYWLAASAYGGPWDIRRPMVAAVRDYISYRSSGIASLEAWRRQLSLIDQPATLGNPIAERLLEILDERRGPIQLSKMARHFASEAAQSGGGQISMLAPKSPLDALNEQPGAPQVTMFAERLPRPRGEDRGQPRTENLPRATIQGGDDPTNVEKHAWKRRLQQELIDVFHMPRENAKRVAKKLAAQTLEVFDKVSAREDLFEALVDKFDWLAKEELGTMAIRTIASVAAKLTQGAGAP